MRTTAAFRNAAFRTAPAATVRACRRLDRDNPRRRVASLSKRTRRERRVAGRRRRLRALWRMCSAATTSSGRSSRLSTARSSSVAGNGDSQPMRTNSSRSRSDPTNAQLVLGRKGAIDPIRDAVERDADVLPRRPGDDADRRRGERNQRRGNARSGFSPRCAAETIGDGERAAVTTECEDCGRAGVV